MKLLIQATIVAASLCAGAAPINADDQLPLPRALPEDEGSKFSTADFNKLLQQMRAEREALRNEWQTQSRKNTSPRRPADGDLEHHLKAILQHLQSRAGPAPAQPQAVDALPETPDLPREQETPDPPGKSPTDKPGGSTPPGSVDVLSQAQVLFRSRQFEDALAAFRQIDLRGQKAEVRAPIEYLIAMCLMHLGRQDEALPLLREVANARGDEKVAGYAQWELEMLRWQRNVQERLQEFRQRRESLEKR